MNFHLLFILLLTIWHTDTTTSKLKHQVRLTFSDHGPHSSTHCCSHVIALPHPLFVTHDVNKPRLPVLRHCYRKQLVTPADRSSCRRCLLLRSGIESNPGPRKPKFPCIVCTKACKIKCIACDDCDQWMHKTCIGLTSAELSALGRSEDSWTCPRCSKPNNSSILYTVPDADESHHTNLSTNPVLLDSVSDITQSTRASTSTEADLSSTFDSFTGDNIHTSSPKPRPSQGPLQRTPRFKNLRFLNINFQSLRRKGRLFENIIEDTDPDIIFGTETWLDPDIRSSELLPSQLGYEIHRRDRPNDPHGGILIAAKRHLQLTDVNSSNHTEFLSASFKAEKKKVHIAAYYRPPNKTDEEYLLQVKEDFCKLKAKAKNNILIIAGDFNLPDIDWKQLSIIGNQYTARVNKTFLETISDISVEQIVDFPTRKHNTLDLILTSHPGFRQRCKPIPSIGCSDHDIVLFDTNITARRPKPIRRTIRLWKKADIPGIREDLKNLAEMVDTSDPCIDNAWNTIKSALQECTERRVPSKLSTSRHTNPWMTTEIKRAIRRKQRAYKKAKRTNQKKDNDRYKRLQKEVQYLTRKANRDYLQDTISGDFKDNSKKFWSYVKSKGQESSGVAPLKNKDGFLQSDNTSRANILNDQFVSAFTSEDTSNIPDKGPSSTPTLPRIEVNWKGIHKLLINLKTNKACGPDGIHPFILKAAATELAPALAKLFQHSLDLGEVPSDWREATVVPLFKKGDKHIAANYRPVSLTSITCKLLEHVIHSSVMSHFDQHNILCPNQHGFRKRRSCESQLLTTIQEIASNTAKGKQVDVILLDFAKAFDKVPHERLIHKLDHYGVRGSVKKWIRSFLSHRTQQVIIDGAKSDTAAVTSGVPQGTVLGPLLFLAYINDLPETIRYSSTKLFADDSMLFKVIDTNHDSQLLQEDLSALENWEKTWQMSFNPSKCTVLQITPHRRKKVINTRYHLHGQLLEIVEASKYLGVTITNTLSWDAHVNNITSKASRTIGFLRRNLRECTTAVKDVTYKAMVRPTLESASTVWDPCNKASIQALEQVQKRAARYVSNDYSSKTPGCVTQMMKNHGWKSLESRRRHSRLSMFYKIQHHLVDIPCDQYLRSNDSRTRGQHRFFQERISDNTYANSFFPRTTRDWNSLPTRIVTAPTLEDFRSLLA